MKFTKITLTTLLVIILLAITVTAQTEDKDTDKDTIIDKYDVCPNTTELLPKASKNPEIWGCDCTQLKEILNSPECVTYICSENSEILIEYKNGQKEIMCPQSYCEQNNYIEYEEQNITVMCTNGKLNQTCTKKITENSSKCQNKEPETNQTITPEPEFNFYNYYQDITYLEKKQKMNKQQFQQVLQQTKNMLTILEKTTYEEKQKGDLTYIQQKKQIILEPIKSYNINSIQIYQHIPFETNINEINFITQPTQTDHENNILKWEINNPTTQKIIEYTINKETDLETQTTILAQGKPKSKIMFILPYILIAAILLISYYFLKSRIKKDKES